MTDFQARLPTSSLTPYGGYASSILHRSWARGRTGSRPKIVALTSTAV